MWCSIDVRLRHPGAPDFRLQSSVLWGIHQQIETRATQRVFTVLSIRRSHASLCIIQQSDLEQYLMYILSDDAMLHKSAR